MSDPQRTPDMTSEFYGEIRERGLAGAAAVNSASADNIDVKAAALADSSPYAQLVSVHAVGDLAALLLAATISSPNVLATGGAFLLTWAIVAPLLGAYDNARTYGPAAALGVTVALGCGLTEGQAGIGAIAVTALETIVLVASWRVAFFAVRKANRALDSFVLAVVDEDGGDDDF